MREKIILVYPGAPGHALMLPLGILSVGAYAAKFGYHIEFFDMRLDDITTLNFDGCIVIGISAMTGPQIGYGIEFSKLAKEKNPQITVVWGGIHPTILPGGTVRNQYVDIVVKGEGEIIFKNLLDCLFNNKSLQDVKGICYKDESGQVIHNPDEETFSFDIIPPLPYSNLKNIDKYGCIKMFPYELSRGCPGKCTFCFNNQKKGAKKWRSRSIEKIVNDIDKIVAEFNPKTLYFVDDQALANKRLIKKVAQAFIDNKWTFPNHVINTYW